MNCIDKKMTEFLNDEKSGARNDKEFCTEEKVHYFNYMKEHFKNEYENIIRIDENSY